MSVLIKMEMPRSCLLCPMYFLGRCRLLGRTIPDLANGKLPDICPIIEIKTPHGRLVDGDALMNAFAKAERSMQEDGKEYSFSFLSPGLEVSTEWDCVNDLLENTPTIIEAEEGDANG